jgi:hypothetical protein
LFSIVIAKDVRWDDQLLAAVLALAAALFSVQLLAKHGSKEKEMAGQATHMEVDGGFPAPNDKKDAPEPWYLSQSSYRLWPLLLLIFGAVSLGVTVRSVFTNVLSGA